MVNCETIATANVGLLMKILPAFVLLLVILFAPNALTDDSPLSADIDLLLKEQQLTGIVWSAYSGSGLLSGASGMADVARQIRMPRDAKVHVGSVTKTVLALGVLRLISAGRLSLDTDVEQLLPTLNWHNPWRDSAPVRVLHLLEHTAGLDNIRLWQFLSIRPTPDTPLVDAFPTSRSDLLRLRSKPGSQYSYSNMGYTLLGLVIEAVSGQRYEDYLEQALLLPLDMRDSSFRLVDQSADPRLAMGYVGPNQPQTSVTMFLRPAGQFTTTAYDMLKLMDFILGEGRIDQAPWVRPELMKRLGRSTTTDAVKSGLDNSHGLALASRDRHGVLGYCHPGTSFGFRAYLCLFPKERKAFFYAINADSEVADYEAFNQLFIEYLEVGKEASVDAAANSITLSGYTGLYVLSPNNMQQFAWVDWLFNSIWISETEGALLIHSLQQAQRRLAPVTDTVFRAMDRQLSSHVFMGVGGTTLSDGLKTYRATSPYWLLANYLALLLGLVGFLYVLIRGSVLMVLWRPSAARMLLLPYLNIVAFAVPVYLFFQQNYLEFGDKTAASALLAALSIALPVSLLIALVAMLKTGRARKLDLLGSGALLQLCLLFFWVDVFPLAAWM